MLSKSLRAGEREGGEGEVERFRLSDGPSFRIGAQIFCVLPRSPRQCRRRKSSLVLVEWGDELVVAPRKVSKHKPARPSSQREATLWARVNVCVV